MHVNSCPRKPEVFESPGAEVTGGYKLPIVGAGDESQWYILLTAEPSL